MCRFVCICFLLDSSCCSSAGAAYTVSRCILYQQSFILIFIYLLHLLHCWFAFLKHWCWEGLGLSQACMNTNAAYDGLKHPCKAGVSFKETCYTNNYKPDSMLRFDAYQFVFVFVLISNKKYFFILCTRTSSRPLSMKQADLEHVQLPRYHWCTSILTSLAHHFEEVDGKFMPGPSGQLIWFDSRQNWPSRVANSSKGD